MSQLIFNRRIFRNLFRIGACESILILSFNIKNRDLVLGTEDFLVPKPFSLRFSDPVWIYVTKIGYPFNVGHSYTCLPLSRKVSPFGRRQCEFILSH